MKRKLLSILIPILMTPLMGIDLNPTFSGVKIYSVSIGPYEKYQNSSEGSLKIVSFEQNPISVYEIVRFGPDSNPSFKTKTFPIHEMQLNEIHTITFDVPTKTLLGNDGMNITIEIKDNSNNSLFKSTSKIYPINPTTIRALDYTNTTFSSSATMLKLSNSNIVAVSEKLKFSDFVDYFKTDVYYRLNVEQFKFTYDSDNKTLKYKSAYMIITGAEQYFPGLTYTSGKCYIPISLSKSSNTISVSLNSTFYVEPKLLLISLTPRQGYLQTRYFYLPVNHIKDLLGLSISFEINEFGLNKTTIKWNSAILSASGLIGKCHNSEYCIEGEVSK